MPQGTQHAARCPKHAPETPVHTTTRILHTQPRRLRLTYLPLYPRVFPLDAELANAVSGRQKHPVRSVWIAAAALGRANPLGHLTELQLPLADGHQEVHRHERASVQQWQDAPSLSLGLDEQCCSLHL